MLYSSFVSPILYIIPLPCFGFTSFFFLFASCSINLHFQWVVIVVVAMPIWRCVVYIIWMNEIKKKTSNQIIEFLRACKYRWMEITIFFSTLVVLYNFCVFFFLLLCFFFKCSDVGRLYRKASDSTFVYVHFWSSDSCSTD